MPQPTVTCLTLALRRCIKMGSRNITFPPKVTLHQPGTKGPAFLSAPTERLLIMSPPQSCHISEGQDTIMHISCGSRSSSILPQLFRDLLKLTHLQFCFSQMLFNNFFREEPQEAERRRLHNLIWFRSREAAMDNCSPATADRAGRKRFLFKL